MKDYWTPLKLIGWASAVLLSYLAIVAVFAPKDDLSQTNGLAYLLAPFGFFIIFPVSFLMLAAGFYQLVRHRGKK